MSQSTTKSKIIQFSNLIPDYSLENEPLINLQKESREILKSGIHGLCFSIYEKGQAPGDIISKEQVKRRLSIIKPYTSWVRSFSCIEGNGWVPILAKDMGLKTMTGAWLGKDQKKNKKEIAELIKLAKNGYVDIAAVGNEVLYRNDLSLNQLLDYLKQVKEALPGIPVAYVDAYYEFSNHPQLTEICDIILCNCYPFWEGCSFEYAVSNIKQMYNQAKKAGGSKRVVIAETGWPTNGQNVENAIPTYANALKYFLQSQQWAKKENIEMFYFSSFDEEWKISAEGNAGAHWGLWDTQGKLKF